MAFLIDFTGKLSDMNLELQGKNKCITQTISTVPSYKSKFELMITDLTNSIFYHFLTMLGHPGKYPNFVLKTEKYVTEICCYTRFRK
jgi:hypothetical protein